MRKRKGKMWGILLLAAAMTFAAVQPVFAEETANKAQAEEEKETEDEGKGEEDEEKNPAERNSIEAGGDDGVSAADDASQGKPSVSVSEVIWKGGLLEVPVELNGANAHPEVLKIVSGGQTQWFYCTKCENGKAAFSILDGYSTCDSNQILGKKGEYDAEITFLPEDNTSVGYATSQFKVKVESDSQMWGVTPKTEVFDGSRDITFSFQNGTNYYQLQSISSIELFVVKTTADESAKVNPVLTDGFTVDMNAGTLKIDKNAVKKALLDKKTQIEEARKTLATPLPISAYVNVSAMTPAGETIVFNSVNGTSSNAVIEPAWQLDLTNFDWSTGSAGSNGSTGSTGSTGGTDTSADKITTEYIDTTSGQLMVSQENRERLERNVLSYIQKNYAEQLKSLGNDYKVMSRIQLTVQGDSDIQQAAKKAFSDQLDQQTIGQYYEISLWADVTKNGKTVQGLANIPIPQLEQKIVLSLKIPETLKKEGRTYQILHYKGGAVETVNSMERDGIIYFQTDSFSPYALVYRDVQTDTPKTDKTDSTSGSGDAVSPKTGDLTDAAGFFVTGMFSFSLFALCLVWKKKNI